LYLISSIKYVFKDQFDVTLKDELQNLGIKKATIIGRFFM